MFTCFSQSLLLLNYLVKNGSERVVTSTREHLYDLRGLENYTCVDEQGKDQGVNIRHKVKEMIDFIQDDDKLREERKKAKKNKDKYVGVSSDTMGMGMGYRTGGGSKSKFLLSSSIGSHDRSFEFSSRLGGSSAPQKRLQRLGGKQWRQRLVAATQERGRQLLRFKVNRLPCSLQYAPMSFIFRIFSPFQCGRSFGET